MKTLLLASSNAGKLRELEAIFSEHYPAGSVRLLLPGEIGLQLDVVEDGDTYAANAARKAVAYARVSGLIALADDSGLEVEALDGRPGLHSARFGIDEMDGPPSDAKRRAHLIKQLQGKPRPWKARFVSTVAIAVPGGGVQFACGEALGEILPEERGSNGFGYDPVFYIPELGCTTAEISAEEKNRISHRANAVRAAFPILDELFENRRFSGQ